MEKVTLDVIVDTNDKRVYEEKIYEKLKEAEMEMNNTTKRYTKEEIIKSLINNNLNFLTKSKKELQ